jgi:hypothetical protein
MVPLLQRPPLRSHVNHRAPIRISPGGQPAANVATSAKLLTAGTFANTAPTLPAIIAGREMTTTKPLLSLLTLDPGVLSAPRRAPS